MQPGPEQILECPDCRALARVSTLASGNTFGARWWTDGKMDAPMMPEQPSITKCKGCEGFFWIPDAKVLGGCIEDYIYERSSYDPSDRKKIPSAWTRAGWVGLLAEEELIEALTVGAANNKEQELYLRIRLWWATNEPYRDLEPDDSGQDLPVRSDMAKANLGSLFNLLSVENQYERLMKAEVARELGRFDEALRILDSDFPQELENVVSLIRKLAEKGDYMVREIAS